MYLVRLLCFSLDSSRERKKRKWNKLFDVAKVDLWQNRHLTMKKTKRFGVWVDIF